MQFADPRTIFGLIIASSAISSLASAVNSIKPDGLNSVANALSRIVQASAALKEIGAVSTISDLEKAISDSGAAMTKAAGTITTRPTKTAMALLNASDRKTNETLGKIHDVLKAISDGIKEMKVTPGEQSKEAAEIVRLLREHLPMISDPGFSPAPVAGKWRINNV